MFEVKKLMKNRIKYIDKFNKLFIKFLKGANFISSIYLFEKINKMWEAIKFSSACLDEKDKADTIYHEVFGGAEKILNASNNKLLSMYVGLATIMCENTQFTFKQLMIYVF